MASFVDQPLGWSGSLLTFPHFPREAGDAFRPVIISGDCTLAILFRLFSESAGQLLALLRMSFRYFCLALCMSLTTSASSGLYQCGDAFYSLDKVSFDVIPFIHSSAKPMNV